MIFFILFIPLDLMLLLDFFPETAKSYQSCCAEQQERGGGWFGYGGRA